VDTAGAKEPEASPHEDIIFKNVTFAYPSRPNVKVLDGLNVHFTKGMITAIVGPSGSGKSTIVGLLERWYQLSEPVTSDTTNEEPKKEGVSEPPRVFNSGSIKVGAHDVQDLDLKWWRSQIGLVQQEPFCFNDTVYKNVEYGLVGSPWEREDGEMKKKLVKEACHEAYADEFINRLPQVCYFLVPLYLLVSFDAD
jgi:ATP-binding cassette subfamily B (MDR/TAP) protein 1